MDQRMEQQQIVPSFLALDDEPAVSHLLVQVLALHGFRGEACTDGDQALRALGKGNFEVVLADMNMQGMDGMQFLKRVRSDFPHTALVIMTGTYDVHRAVQVMKNGACDYLLKPLQPDTVVASFHRALELRRLDLEAEKRRRALEDTVQFQAEQLHRASMLVAQTHDDVLQTLGRALDLRDYETADHCRRVTKYSIELAEVMKCSPELVKQIAQGAYLHDLGKIGIPDAILRKPGPLTKEERDIMETHVQLGHDLLSHFPFFEAPAEIILTHQEHFDGKGYPQGLTGCEIPIGARIFAVADALDAMTSDRPYRQALPYSIAREEIVRQSGRQFDPKVVEAFLSLPEKVWENIRLEIDGPLLFPAPETLG